MLRSSQCKLLMLRQVSENIFHDMVTMPVLLTLAA